MADTVTLSKEQLEMLNDGETIQVTEDIGHRDVRVHPPCEEYGHDWGYYNIDRNDDKVERKCKKCNEREKIEFESLGEMFEHLRSIKNKD